VIGMQRPTRRDGTTKRPAPHRAARRAPARGAAIERPIGAVPPNLRVSAQGFLSFFLAIDQKSRRIARKTHPDLVAQTRIRRHNYWSNSAFTNFIYQKLETQAAFT
jgi:hypothetical protein